MCKGKRDVPNVVEAGEEAEPERGAALQSAQQRATRVETEAASGIGGPKDGVEEAGDAKPSKRATPQNTRQQVAQIASGAAGGVEKRAKAAGGRRKEAGGLQAAGRSESGRDILPKHGDEMERVAAPGTAAHIDGDTRVRCVRRKLKTIEVRRGEVLPK